MSPYSPPIREANERWLAVRHQCERDEPTDRVLSQRLANQPRRLICVHLCPSVVSLIQPCNPTPIPPAP